MNPFVLYLILLKASVTTFGGLASLPVLREDLVVHRQAITDEQLNISVVVTKTTPGPNGLYIVSVGYFAGGVAGALAGWAAMVTPPLLIIPLVRHVGKRAEHPRVKSVLQAVILSSAGLLWASTWPIAEGAVNDLVSLAILVGSCAALWTGKLDSVWVILMAVVLQMTAASAGLVSAL